MLLDDEVALEEALLDDATEEDALLVWLVVASVEELTSGALELSEEGVVDPHDVNNNAIAISPSVLLFIFLSLL